MLAWLLASTAFALPKDTGILPPDTGTPVDYDGDGYGAAIDCDDSDASIHPGAFDVPDNGVDDNCSSGDSCYRDADNDGARLTTTIVSTDLDCLDAFEGRAADLIDCNDASSAIYPGAAEVVADGVDQSCDGQELCYADNDNDGARLGSTMVSADADCLDAFEGVATDVIDCNDANASVKPGAVEIVGDSIDEDCNLSEICYADADNDGSRTTGTVTSADADCLDALEGLLTDAIDCVDTNSAIHPGAAELTADGVDQDCNGQELCYTDADNDGARLSTTVVSADVDCVDAFEGLAADAIDCNDGSASVFPGASEVIADGIDQSCDGGEVCYADSDNDGSRTSATVTSVDADCLDANEGLSTDTIDCVDTNAAIHPGAAELFADGVDQDCNGQELCYADADNDGSRTSGSVVSTDLDCNDASEGVAADTIDCNDASASVHPGAAEVVGDSIDQDCSGGEICYADADNDGSRTTGTVTSADADCNDASEGSAADGIDCNDANGAVHPGAAEIVADQIDEDCNGQELCYGDGDNDGSRSSSTVTSTDADCVDSFEAVAADPIDCNDASASVHPGATEVLADSVDQDCSGGDSCYTDADNDGARTSGATASTDLDCLDAFEGVAADPVDCNDANSAVSPLATEVVGDGVDQSCDGLELCFTDSDNDGSRLTSTVSSADLDCLDANEGQSTDPIDCNDASASVHPGATEVVADGVDQDCNGGESCYADADNDGSRTSSAVSSSDLDCLDPSEGVAADPIDCNDASASVHPGASEVVADGIDQDCDGGEDCYTDADNDGSRTTGITASADTDCADANEALAADTIDCNDASAVVHPGAAEVIGDGVDQDCNNGEVCYVDSDSDGSRSASTVTSADLDCADGTEAPASDPVDCNDASSGIHPGATELAGDAIDQDCSGTELCFADADNDGARDGAATVSSADVDCADANEGALADAVDCDESDAAIHPGASEGVGDEVDGNCDGAETCWADTDADGARSAGTTASADLDCDDALEASSAAALDCDDADSTRFPGAGEVVGDLIDQDCDGGETCFADADLDLARGESPVASADLDCDDAGEGSLASPVDCDDANSAIFPGATEIVGDQIDEDCDGGEICYVDGDLDGARVEDVATSADPDCIDPGEGLVDEPLDCNDADAAVSPLLPELCDGVDNDCDLVLDVPDCDPDDSDTDGILNVDEEALCSVSGLDPTMCPVDPDVDGDGVIDGVEVGSVDQPLDTDGDSLLDFADPDDDADLVTSRRENGITCGGDLVASYDVGAGYWTFSCYGLEYDFGGNTIESYPDTDGDAQPDFRDTDDDGDGVDTQEEGPGDLDCDGVANYLDADDADGPCTEDPPDSGAPTTDDPGDPPTGTPTTDTSAGSDGGPESPKDPTADAGCGCASSRGASGWLLLGALALARRRR